MIVSVSKFPIIYCMGKQSKYYELVFILQQILWTEALFLFCFLILVSKNMNILVKTESKSIIFK